MTIETSIHSLYYSKSQCFLSHLILNLRIGKFLIKKKKISISKSIEKIWLNSNKIYVARKIKAMLELEGIYISERTVGNYMKDMNIASVYRRKYKTTKSVKTKDEDLPNNTKDTHIKRPHHYVATDITYIHTKQDGWVYQITFIDL